MAFIPVPVGANLDYYQFSKDLQNRIASALFDIADATFDNFAQVKLIEAAARPAALSTISRLVLGDGGGGSFYWDAAYLPDEADPGKDALWIRPDDVLATDPGRWRRRMDSQNLQATWFGLLDGAPADEVMANAMACMPDGGVLLVPAGTFIFDAPLVVTKSIMIQGTTGGFNGMGAATSGTIFSFRFNGYVGDKDGVVITPTITSIRGGLADVSITSTDTGILGAAVKTTVANTLRFSNILIGYMPQGALWSYGFWAREMMQSTVDFLQVIQSAVVGIHLESFCNASSFRSCQVVGNGITLSKSTRALEIYNTYDPFFYGCVFQSYFPEAVIYLSNSGILWCGGHIENSLTITGDVQQVDVSVSRPATFLNSVGGNYEVGVDGSACRAFTVVGGEIGSISFGPLAFGCGVTGARISGTFTDNGIANYRRGCINVSGFMLADTSEPDTMVVSSGAMNFEGASFFTLDTAESTSPTFTNPVSAKRRLRVRITYSVGATITWPASVKWGPSGAPKAASPGSIDLVEMSWDGTYYFANWVARAPNSTTYFDASAVGIDTTPLTDKTVTTAQLLAVKVDGMATSQNQPIGRLLYQGTTVGYWQFDGSLAEGNGLGKTLTANDVAAYCDVAPGLRGAFANGTSIYFKRTVYDASLAITGALTLQCLVRFKDIPTNQAWLIGFSGTRGGVAAENCLYALGVQSTGCLQYSADYNNGTVITYAPNPDTHAIPIGCVFHLAMTRAAGGSVKFYINGKLVSSSGALPVPTGGGNGTLRIMSNGGGSPIYMDRGNALCDARIDNVEYSDSDILALYNASLGKVFGVRT